VGFLNDAAVRSPAVALQATHATPPGLRRTLQLILIFGFFDHAHLEARERGALVRRYASSSRGREGMPTPPVPAPDGIADVADEHRDHRDRDPEADGPRVEQSDRAEH